MTFQRKLIRSEIYTPSQSTTRYRIEARFMGPDLLCYVDGQELGSFYLDAPGAIEGGQRYCDLREKDKREGRGR